MIVIVTKTPEGISLQGEASHVQAWAWLHTLRTGDEPENMQQVLDWARDEMVAANLSEEVITDMITNEINNIMLDQSEPKPELIMDSFDSPEIA